MKDKKNCIMILAGTILGIVLMGVVVCFTISRVKLVDKTYSAKVETSNGTVNEEISAKDEVPVYEYFENVIEKSVSDDSNIKITTSTSNEATKQEVKEEITNKITDTVVSVDEKSQKVISYVENLENTVFTEENIKEYGQKAKAAFIDITDFIFYGKEINGYTFDELTEQAKLYVMDIAVKIDSQIEAIYPGYKDTLKSNASAFINDLTLKYLEVTNNICSKMGTAACNQAKQDIETMKENFGLTLELAKTVGESTIDSLKNWYEIFKSNN